MLDQKLRSPGSVRVLCEMAQDDDLSVKLCLEGTGLTQFDLYDPGTKITMGQELQVIQNFLKQRPYRAGLGIEVGRRIKPEVLGIWGFALMTSPNLRASLTTAIDYSQLSFLIAPMDFLEQKNEAMVTFDTSALPPEIKKFVLERHLTVLLNFGAVSLPKRIAASSHFVSTEYDPEFANAIEQELGVAVKPSEDLNAVVFSSEILDVPFPQHDPEVLAVCLKQCDNLRSSSKNTSWVARVHDEVLSDIGNGPTIDSVAQSLKTSKRTLARRLSEEGTSFRSILVQVRLAVAHEMLTTTNLSVSKVAWRAGYAEPSSFVRAYTKAYGHSPGKTPRHRDLDVLS